MLHVWVSSEIGGIVSIIDVKTLKIVKKIGFAINGVEKELIQPVGIAYSKKGLVFWSWLRITPLGLCPTLIVSSSLKFFPSKILMLLSFSLET
jgi:hypothetical protein